MTWCDNLMALIFLYIYIFFCRPKDKRELQASIRTTTEKNTILTRLNSELNQELAEVSTLCKRPLQVVFNLLTLGGHVNFYSSLLSLFVYRWLHKLLSYQGVSY